MRCNGRSCSAASTLCRPRRSEREGAGRLGGQDAVGGFPRQRRGHPLQHQSVCLKVVDPAVTGSAPEAQAAFAKEMVAAAREGKRRLTTSTATAMRLRACACGAARQSNPPDVAVLTEWLDWAFAQAHAKVANRFDSVADGPRPLADTSRRPQSGRAFSPFITRTSPWLHAS